MNKKSPTPVPRRKSSPGLETPRAPRTKLPADASDLESTQPPACAVDIDPEFRELTVPLSADGWAELERRLVAEGCSEPLVVWAGHDIMLDGHKRLTICQQHGLAFRIERLALPDREAARAWVIANQIGRQPPPPARSYLRGKRYLALKRQGRRSDLDRGRNGHGPSNGRSGSARREGTCGQNGHSEALPEARTCGQNGRCPTARRLAAEYRVGERTIRRDGDFVGYVDRLTANCGEVAKRLILSREVRLTHEEVAWWAALPVGAQQRQLQHLLAAGKLDRREPEKQRMVVPREPKALAQTVVRRLGLAAAARVHQALGKLLRDARPDKGRRPQ